MGGRVEAKEQERKSEKKLRKKNDLQKIEMVLLCYLLGAYSKGTKATYIAASKKIGRGHYKKKSSAHIQPTIVSFKVNVLAAPQKKKMLECKI